MTVTVNFYDLSPKIKRQIPNYAYGQEDAGIDFHSTEECCILPGRRKLVSTGLSWDIELSDELAGYKGYMQLTSKSGLASKRSLDCGAGVIDSGYRGEIKVLLINNTLKHYGWELLNCFPFLRKTVHKHYGHNVKTGDAIAQGIIHLLPMTSVQCKQGMDKTKNSVRGEKGFGSTYMPIEG